MIINHRNIAEICIVAISISLYSISPSKADTHCEVDNYAVGRWKPIYEDYPYQGSPAPGANPSVQGYRYPCSPTSFDGGGGYGRVWVGSVCSVTKIEGDKKYQRNIAWSFVFCVASVFSPHWIGSPNDIGLDCQENPPPTVSEGDTHPDGGDYQHYFKDVTDQKWIWECTGTIENSMGFGPPCGEEQCCQ